MYNFYHYVTVLSDQESSLCVTCKLGAASHSITIPAGHAASREKAFAALLKLSTLMLNIDD